MRKQALNVGFVSVYRHDAKNRKAATDYRIKRGRNDNQRREHKGCDDRAEGHIMRGDDDDDKHEETDHRLKGIDDQQAAKAGGDALAALKAEEHREIMAQHRAQNAQHTAQITANERLADENGNDALKDIAQEGEQRHPLTVDAEHIGRTGIFAAMVADIGMLKSLGQQNARGDAAQKVGDCQRQDHFEHDQTSFWFF